jgi:hypothetical protein
VYFKHFVGEKNLAKWKTTKLSGIIIAINQLQWLFQASITRGCRFPVQFKVHFEHFVLSYAAMFLLVCELQSEFVA